jgi:streptomycin 3"-adenylyltransferase
MALYGWRDCPVAVREQVDRLVSTLHNRLAERLVGIYLHGSLALGCFNPNHSDLDLIVITTERLSPGVKRQIIEYLLACSQQPQPIEISFLALTQLRPWHYPPPFDLHYSESWRASYTRDLGSDQAWDDNEHRDPDLAAHVTIINQRGICLAGAPITEIFPAVPADDYRASIAEDINDSLASIVTNPIYTILNCCRTYAYVRDGHVFSKEEGGHWAIQVLPADFRAVVATALAVYRSDTGHQSFDANALSTFATYMRRVLAPALL